MPALPSKRSANPSAFHVVTSSSAPRSPATDASLLSSFSSSVAARFAAAHPASSSSSSLPTPTPSPSSALALLTELSLIESLSAGPVPLPTLRAQAAQLSPQGYADLLAERHAAGLCPYAACARGASEAYAPEGARGRGSARVRMRGGGLVARGGGGGDTGSEGEGDRGAYCSRRCRARSEHLAREVARRRGALDALGAGGAAVGGRWDGEVELLEDVEQRREDVRRSTREVLLQAREQAQAEAEAQGQAPSADEAARAQPSPEVGPAPRPPPPPSGDAGAAPKNEGPDNSDQAAAFGASLLSSLAIHERPTPSLPPSAPSLSLPPRDFESPLPHPSLVPLPRTHPLPPAPAPQRPPLGARGLPPPRFLTAPVMLDPATGSALEWAGVGEDGMELGMSDEERRWMVEALRVREECRGRGEVE